MFTTTLNQKMILKWPQNNLDTFIRTRKKNSKRIIFTLQNKIIFLFSLFKLSYNVKHSRVHIN